MKKILFVAAAAVVIFSGCAVKTGINNGDLQKSPCACLGKDASKFSSWSDINSFISKYLYPRVILS